MQQQEKHGLKEIWEAYIACFLLPFYLRSWGFIICVNKHSDVLVKNPETPQTIRKIEKDRKESSY